MSSYTIAPSTTSTKNGLLASPSSSATQGALPRRPSHFLALCQVRVRWLMERLHHLCPKMAPWRQGARPLGVTHRVWRPREKKEADKKSLGLREAPMCSLHRHDKTAYCLWQRCAGTIKRKLCISKGPR